MIMATPLKKATLRDIPLLVSLMDGFYAESGLALDHERANRAFNTIMADESLGSVWFIQTRNDYAGYLVITQVFSMEYGGFSAVLEDIYIRPNHRGFGLGKAALAGIIPLLKERGVYALSVETGRNNLAARALYTKAGFKPSDRQMLRLELAPPLHER